LSRLIGQEAGSNAQRADAITRFAMQGEFGGLPGLALLLIKSRLAVSEQHKSAPIRGRLKEKPRKRAGRWPTLWVKLPSITPSEGE
jgi:hypothetical protein